jgi:hypothetical protein
MVMTQKKAAKPPAKHLPYVVFSARQHGDLVFLDYRLGDSQGAASQKDLQHCRVLIRSDETLDASQLIQLCARQVTYVLARLKPVRAVKRGLAWREVGVSEWSVPPGGGEGGELPGQDPLPGI